MRILESDDEKLKAINALALKYNPNDSEQSRNMTINREYNRLCIIELSIEHMTGKEAIELVNKK